MLSSAELEKIFITSRPVHIEAFEEKNENKKVNSANPDQGDFTDFPVIINFGPRLISVFRLPRTGSGAEGMDRATKWERGEKGS